MGHIAPLAVRNFNKDGYIEIDWPGNKMIRYTHEMLRVECPCSACRGHSPEQKKTISDKEDVRITSINPVGNYAFQIGFDDGHDTGLYTFDELQRLAEVNQ